MARDGGEIGLLPRISRRHAALLQRDKLGAASLTMHDVASLEANPSALSRAMIARKFGAQYDAMSTSVPPALAEALLQRLAGDGEAEVRRSLAQAVAASGRMPPAVASRLARDRFDVAAPILEKCLLLKDAELIEIVSANAVQYALAVAGRERLSEPVADCLARSGQRPVVARLAGNGGAALSVRTLRRLMEDWCNDSEIAERLARRPALPFESVLGMVAEIGRRIEWALVRERRMDPLEARRLMQAMRDRTAMSFTAREHDDRQKKQHPGRRSGAGLVDHDAVLRFLQAGDVAAFELALGLQARLEPRLVRALVCHADRHHLAALCLKAALPAPHHLAIRMVLELASRGIEPGGGPKEALADETLRLVHAQYEDLRGDPARLEHLLAVST